jgi:hypothetical protein
MARFSAKIVFLGRAEHGVGSATLRDPGIVSPGAFGREFYAISTRAGHAASEGIAEDRAVLTPTTTGRRS